MAIKAVQSELLWNSELNKHGIQHEESYDGKILRLRTSWVAQLHEYGIHNDYILRWRE